MNRIIARLATEMRGQSRNGDDLVDAANVVRRLSILPGASRAAAVRKAEMLRVAGLLDSIASAMRAQIEADEIGELR